MLKDPVKIGRLFAKLSARLKIPVSAKIRLGWDQHSRNYLDSQGISICGYSLPHSGNTPCKFVIDCHLGV